MLIVAVRRLRALRPYAEITALTYETEPFRKHCPGVTLFSLNKRDAWLDSGNQNEAEQFLDLMRSADLFLMSGCGAINDVWSANATRILVTFELAMRLNVPTAMMGQGIGPLRNPALVAVAERVVPQMQLVGVRDQQSMDLVSSLGIGADRTHLTGDDALEMAYAERPEKLGANIGVNLRLAEYSGITEPVAAKHAEHLTAKAKECGAGLLGLPISRFRGESDSESLRRAFGAASVPFDVGSELDTPVKVIQRTRDCRIVVTASYHAAVFALAMGVPAVGIAQSDYYRQKFKGLEGLFGDGCVVIDAAQADTELGRNFDRLWNDAPRLRDSLIGATAAQIGKSLAAYEAILKLQKLRTPEPNGHA
jgi:colanic acid/amylovoran biosynthesis protein